MPERYEDFTPERHLVTSQAFDVYDEPLNLSLGGHPLTVLFMPILHDPTTEEVHILDKWLNNADPTRGVMRLRDGETLVLGRFQHPGVLDFTSKVSRRHTQVCRNGSVVTVTDLGSKNGTFVIRESPVDYDVFEPEDTVGFSSMSGYDDMEKKFGSFSAASSASEYHPDSNEDAYFVSQPHGIAGVFDGVGGQKGSQIAAQIAAQVCSEMMVSMTDESSVLAVENELKRIMAEASKQIQQNPNQGIATTATITKLFTNENGKKLLSVAYIGDSLAYLLRDDNLLFLTPDSRANHHAKNVDPLEVQRILGEVSIKSELSVDLQRAFENRHIITASLGQYFDEDQVNVFTYEVFEGEKIVLVTDGISDNLTSSEIQALCLSMTGTGDQAQDLVSAAQERSRNNHDRAKPDDMTAVITAVGR